MASIHTITFQQNTSTHTITDLLSWQLQRRHRGSRSPCRLSRSPSSHSGCRSPGRWRSSAALPWLPAGAAREGRGYLQGGGVTRCEVEKKNTEEKGWLEVVKDGKRAEVS